MLMEMGEQTLDKNSIVWNRHAGGVTNLKITRQLYQIGTCDFI
jgi:hypothetical protein